MADLADSDLSPRRKKQLESRQDAADDAFEIESLWKKRVASIKGQILEHEKDYLEVANVAEHIGADYHGRFLIELIQNAEDRSRKKECTTSGEHSNYLIIVRTKRAIAVLNQGAPFSKKDIESITSLGLSTKDPEKSLGNKGIGFKAVFQITDSPEVYSRPESVGDLWSENANRFCMQKRPFDDVKFSREIAKIVELELSCNPKDAEKLEKHPDNKDHKDDSTAFLIEELKKAAPFKFPKPLNRSDMKNRIEELGLSNSDVGTMSTMVVLPLPDRPETDKTVNDALRELSESDHPGATILFLTEINRLRILDRINDSEVLLQRDEGTKKLLEHGIEIRDVTTKRIESNRNCDVQTASASWWLASRRFGEGGSDSTTLDEEEALIKEAVKSLGIRTWKNVRSAHVGVGLPRSTLGEHLEPLGPCGIFCIGLPTHVDTGMPIWVNGPFHGHINRTDIDFGSQNYNRIILKEGIKVLWTAINHIKSLPDANDKRHAVLELESKAGHPFQSGITEDRDLSSEAIVLNAEGTGYFSPGELKIPAQNDIAAFNHFFAKLPDLERHGLRLPDDVLLKNCWGLLDQLRGDSEIEAKNQTYLQRPNGGQSLLERAAAEHRTESFDWWEKFLEWIIDRFEFSDIQDQCILPIGLDKLASASDRVFFRPLTASDDQPAQQDDTDLPEEAAIDDLDDKFFDNLAFLDEHRVQVREKEGLRSLTKLARKLSEQGKELVRNPRKPEIINDLLAPYLSKICTIHAQREEAIVVLAKIGDWLCKMKLKSKQLESVKLEKILVPVFVEGDQWDWLAPTDVYFGDGWLDHETDKLIREAYGESESTSHRLPSFEIFRKHLKDELDAEVEKNNWCARFKKIGVLTAPKFIQGVNTQAYFKANSFYQLKVLPEFECSCPIDEAQSYWKSYLYVIAKRRRKTSVCSGQLYYIQDPVWIDGLEREKVRTAVMKLVLLNAKEYKQKCEIKVGRYNSGWGGDSSQMLSLWVHAVVDEQWPIIPTNLEPRSPSKAWILDETMQRQNFASDKLIAFVKSPYDKAVKILNALGVYSPKKAPVSRIVEELQDVAEKLDCLLETKRQATDSFIRELYIWLQEASARSDKSEEDLRKLKKRPVPLMDNGSFIAVDLSLDAIILLNDDPERLPYIKTAKEKFVLPLHARQPKKALYKALRGVFGSDRVMRASKEKIELQFQQTESETPLIEPLIDYLVRELKSQCPNIQLELAALIAYAGTPPMDPNKKTFRKKWRQFQKTLVRRGIFTNRNQATESVFDRRAEGGATLYVPSENEPVQVLEACWRLMGKSQKDSWENYAFRLKSGETDKFFNGKLDNRDWDELESVVGQIQESKVAALQPALLALYRSREPNIEVEQFLKHLDSISASPDKIATYIGIDNDVLKTAMNDSSLRFDDERQLPVIETLRVPIPDWQQARRDLDNEPVSFSSTVNMFEKERDNIVIYLKAYFAYHEKDVNLLHDLKELLIAFKKISCPDVVAQKKINDFEINRLPAGEFCSVINLETKVGKALDRGLRSIESVNSVDDFSTARILKREIDLYKHQTEEHRESNANEAVSNVIQVACELSNNAMDGEQIKSKTELSPWLQGYWANSFAALRALREILRESASEKIFQELDKVDAFTPQRSDIDSIGKLRSKFPELAEPANPTASPEAEETKILGILISEDQIDNDLNRGSDGIIGQEIVKAAANEKIDLISLATRNRNSQSGEGISNGFSGGRNQGGSRRSGDQKEGADTRTGLTGESFFYEYGCKHLPNFDSSCWVSDSRRKYGFNQGDDGLGYDFAYTDIEGKLFGSKDQPHCLIEVKSTSSAENVPFPITQKEWDVAKQCHTGQIAKEYVIVRVADAKGAPYIADVICNPVQLWHDGKLKLDILSFRVRID